MRKELLIVALLVGLTVPFNTIPANANSSLNTQSALQPWVSILGAVTEIQQVSEGDGGVEKFERAVQELQAALSLYETSFAAAELHDLIVLGKKARLATRDLALARANLSLSNSYNIDEALDAAFVVLDEAENAELALRRSTELGKSISKTLNTIGTGLNAADVAAKALALHTAIKNDASEYEVLLNKSKLGISAATVAIGVYAKKAALPVAAVAVTTDAATWYADTLGSAVYDAKSARSEAIYNSINTANIIIQSRITQRHRVDPPPTDAEITAIVDREYQELRSLVDSMKDDVSWVDYLYGVGGKSLEEIDEATSLIDYVADNSAADRALKFSQDLLVSKAFEDVAEAFEEIETSVVEFDVALQAAPANPRIVDPNAVITPLNGKKNSLSSDSQAVIDPTATITPLKGKTSSTDSNLTVEELELQRLSDLEVQRQADIAAENARIETARRQAEAARRAEEARVAEVNALLPELDTLSILKADLEARIKDTENEIAALSFHSLEQTRNRLQVVDARVAELRDRAKGELLINDLERDKSRLFLVIQQLNAALEVRNSLAPGGPTAGQKTALNSFASQLGIQGVNGKEDWQQLLIELNSVVQEKAVEWNQINTRLAELRSAGALTSTERAELQALMREQEQLEGRQDDIAGQLRSAENRLTDFEQRLSSTQDSIDTKLNRLAVLDPERTYVPPRFTADGIRDWSNYTSQNQLELPDYSNLSEGQQTASLNDDRDDEPNVLGSNTDDLRDQNTVDLGDSVNPANDPVVAGRGSFSYAAGDGRSSSAQTSFTATNDQTLSSGTNAGNLLRVRGSLGNSQVGAAGVANRLTGYQDTFFGEWTGTYEPGGPGGCVQDPDGTFYCGVREFSHGFWVLGNPSSTATVNNKTGSATFSGVIRGDIAEGSSVREGVVSGDADINIDFSGGDVSGQLEFDVDGNAWDTANIDGSLDDLTGDPGFFSTLSGDNQFGFGSGIFNARFYGSDASELGGAYRYDGSGSATSNGVVSGVIVAQESNINGSDDNEFYPGNSIRRTIVRYYDNEENGGIDFHFLTEHSMLNSNVKIEGSDMLSQLEYDIERGNYRYSSIGFLDENNTVRISSRRGLLTVFDSAVLIGAVSPVFPDRAINYGGASYESEIHGYSENGNEIGGTVDLEFDLLSNRIDGSMNFTKDGNHWMNSPVVDNQELSSQGDRSRLTNRVFFEFGVEDGIGSGSADYLGPNGEEIGGSWIIYWADELENNAQGIFRAESDTQNTYGVTGSPGDTIGTGDGGAGTIGGSSGGATGGTTSDTAAFTSTQNTSNAVASSRGSIDRIPVQGNTLATITIPPLDGGGTLTTTQVLAPAEYNHTQWGRWGANPDTPSAFSSGGYFVAGNLTPSSVVENRTGTASYAGAMTGDFVSGAGSRSSATGTIDLEANFTNQNITGQMQFSHGGNNSPVASLSSGITNGSFSETSTDHGFSGAFFGPNAEEVGGVAWMNANGGKYNGVFRAQEGTSGGAPGVGDPFPGTSGSGNSF